MLLRLIAGAGLFAFGYYLGRQVGLMEPIVDEMKRARDARASASDAAGEAGTDEAHQDTNRT